MNLCKCFIIRSRDSITFPHYQEIFRERYKYLFLSYLASFLFLLMYSDFSKVNHPTHLLSPCGLGLGTWPRPRYTQRSFQRQEHDFIWAYEEQPWCFCCNYCKRDSLILLWFLYLICLWYLMGIEGNSGKRGIERWRQILMTFFEYLACKVLGSVLSLYWSCLCQQIPF